MTDLAKKDVVKRCPDFLAVDFFCGAGGTTRGLIDAGGYVIAGVDKDTRCRETYVENNSNATIDYAPPKFLRRDIFPVTDAYPDGEYAELEGDLERLIEHYRGRVPGTPLLFAICAPCQPFTKLSRKELSEARKAGRERDSNLLTEAAKFVARFRPEMVLSENVQGIGDPKYGGVWDDFKAQLGGLGYATGSKVLCTSNFGVPQYRRRSILVAARRELANPAFLTDGGLGDLIVPEADPDNVVKTVQTAIGHLPPLTAGATDPTIPNHKTRSLSDLNLKRLSAALPGVSNIYMENTPDGDLSLACHRKVNAKLQTRCFTDVYTRMSPDRPSPTITTKCHSISNGRFGHFDVQQLRGISLREAAVLQSFPADYVFYPTHMIEPIARMIGNAVPPRLAEFFSRHLTASIAEPDARDAPQFAGASAVAHG
ncbi:cytosine-specific methyltransferase [Mesorhizobium tianshanense]|uniref:DNA (cytosine-5-)-methyltransferase n=1 Tax=Mesorhizobium tianshanense TaxID=39844 RepID=A0A562NBX3_9HYPH|nr:DNA cytosine methyltransferase [Mesorhizobium tianshanense]TWI29624.1 DNA (cytosine-5)-methyltransferase 1 [Mesorhizobium tianshanense]GLS35238.1 cytosine-specific methyltransferase [Mesorhizobium tianshanense]